MDELVLEKPRQTNADQGGLLAELGAFVLDLCLRFARFLFFSIFQPLAPQLVPLGICALILPFIVASSLFAGGLVWKNAAVGWHEPLYLNYGDGVPPYAEINWPASNPRQPYDVSLHLTIPAVQSNYALGNFMATLKLTTRNNHTVFTVRKPAIVLPPARPLFSTRRTSSLDLAIPLVNAYAAGVGGLIARVEIGRRDGWKSIGTGEGQELSVLSASLRGTLQHPGIRGLLTRYPLLTGSAAAIAFFSISFFMLCACLLPTFFSRLPSSDAASESPVEGGISATRPLPPPAPIVDGAKKPSRSSSRDSDSKPPRRRKTRSTSRTIPDPENVKVEDFEDLGGPAPSTSATSLRRRRSRTTE